MCRLLGVVSTDPTSRADAVGDVVMKDFVALATVHGDGWGVATVEHVGDSPRVEVSADGALQDPGFSSATRDLRSVAALVHLRWATTGMAVEPQNSHPFTADGLAMAHNGAIKPVGALHDLLEAEFAGALRGTTDSERYFALVRQHRRTATTLAEAVRRAVVELRQLDPESSLNALILGEDQLIAVHAHAMSRLRAEDIAEISATDLPAEHLEDYFSLRIARPRDGIVVIGSTGFGSTGFGNLDWEPLPPESVTSIELRDHAVVTLPLVAD